MKFILPFTEDIGEMARAREETGDKVLLVTLLPLLDLPLASDSSSQSIRYRLVGSTMGETSTEDDEGSTLT